MNVRLVVGGLKLLNHIVHKAGEVFSQVLPQGLVIGSKDLVLEGGNQPENLQQRATSGHKHSI